MELQTERLILRPWVKEDAPALYLYAKDPKIGPSAGWAVHIDEDDSRRVIRDVLSEEGTYAVVLKENNAVVGSIGLMLGVKSNLEIEEDEGEIGYWIGVPYWGQGLIPEAIRELMRYGFETLGLSTIWCAYFEGNEKSHRVQEKCGFKYHHTEKDKPCPLINTVMTEHVSCITKKEWKSLNKKHQK